jgi:CRP-like cAMP-binding protein
MTQKIEIASVLPETPKPGFEGLRKELLVAPIIAFLDRFDTFAQKKKKVLAKDEMLFEPGDNPYLYIVASGALGIFRVNPSGEIKEVGKVYTGSFIGEGILSDRNAKDVMAKSITERTEIVSMDKAEAEYLEAQDPAMLAKFYKHINNITSMRLAESGRELSLMYESTQKLQEFQEQGQQGLLSAVNHLRNLLELDSVLMIEQHPYVPGILVYKYNTKFPSIWPMNQKVDSSVVLKPGFSQPDLLTLNQ